MSSALVKSPRNRALMRAGGASAVAFLGVVVALMAPEMFTDADGDTPGLWARWTTVAAVLALVGVAIANVVGLRDHNRMRRLALVACLVAVAAVLVLIGGAFLLSVDKPAGTVGVAVILSSLPLSAVGLALQTRHPDG